MIDELELVRRARPEVRPPSEEARSAARRALDGAIASPAPPARGHRRMLGRLSRLAPAIGILIVIAVGAVFLSVHGRKPSSSASGGRLVLVFRAEPTSQVPVLDSAAMSRALAAMRQRLHAVFPGAQVSLAGKDLIVRVAGTNARAIQEVGTTARLLFYDWEANLLLPNGKTVASLGPALSTNQDALALSQGPQAAPGSPGAGSVNLYDAVKLASKQPALSDAACLAANCARGGAQYYIFGAPGSTACTVAGKALGYTPVPGEHCLVSGPDSGPTALQDVYNGIPQGVPRSQVQLLTVPQGTVVLQATPASFAHPPKIFDPSAQFYVLKDHVALFGNDITNPRQSTDQSGAPDVSFGFTSHGKNAFQNVTATISRRGQLISGIGQHYNQHFAVALDQLLITVPSIDYRTYPDGIPGDTGGDITGGFTSTSANDLAEQLRVGALPVNLKLISIHQRSALTGAR
jgi:SecD/SecF fusion protein